MAGHAGINRSFDGVAKKPAARRNHFSSAALSITDDLLRRNEPLLSH
jgi:hypothetical protein